MQAKDNNRPRQYLTEGELQDRDAQRVLRNLERAWKEFPDVAARNEKVNHDPVNKGWFSLKFENVNPEFGGQIGFECFNAYSSFTKVQTQEFANLVSFVLGYTPVFTLQGMAAVAANIAVPGTGSPVMFDENGNLNIYAFGRALPVGVLTWINDEALSKEGVYNYFGAMQASIYRNFVIRSMRITVTNATQMQNSVSFFGRYDTGENKQLTVKPARYISPEQTDKTIAEIKNVDFTIDGYSGFTYTLNAGETVEIDFQIEFTQSEDIDRRQFGLE